MDSLEAEREAARALDIDDIASIVESVGFECTRCGECCTADGEQAHTATVFPDEIRRVQSETGDPWEAVARPMPYGLDDDGTGETFEWALQTDECGDCVFYEQLDDQGFCTVHDDRPLICQTYPFSIALGDGPTSMGDIVEEQGPIRIHECEGVGRDISRADAVDLAETLKERAIVEIEEAIAVRDGYSPTTADGTVVHDSEGAKRPDGTPVTSRTGDNY